MFKPDPQSPGQTAALPSLVVQYYLPDATGRPVSMLVTRSQDGVDNQTDAYRVSYAYVDGLGRTVVTLSEADEQLDGYSWIVEGLTDYDQKGAPRRKYLAWGYSGQPEAYDLSVPAPSPYGQQRYDAYGRAIDTIGLDGTLTLRTRYHALSADAWDAEDMGPGPHQGTYASEEKDVHGRVIKTTERVREGATLEQRHVETSYLPTGEVTAITRRRGIDAVTRTVSYDTLGRMSANLEASTSYGGRHWRYVYNDAGELVGTSDARGCGVNYDYDAAGRLVSEDYSPCESHHAEYSAAPEVTYHYDVASAHASCMQQQDFTAGKLVWVQDRAATTVSRFDGRGRVVELARQVKGPDGGTTGGWFCKQTQYDAADRVRHETTGASVNLEPQQGSWVQTHYSARGAVSQVDSSYGMLVNRVKRDADGLVTEIEYGDYAQTTTGFDYDDLRRLRNLTTYRANLPQGTPPETGQMLLQDEQYKYDRVGNPVEIRDWRSGAEWPAGSKPVTRKMQYDDLYRVKRIDYEYAEGVDGWVDPYAAEVLDNTRPQPSPRQDFSEGQRPLWQSFSYDWLGNTTGSDDDAQAFYDRSLGSISNDGYRIELGSNMASSSARRGWSWSSYDAAGNMYYLHVRREGPCIPSYECDEETYYYDWDEVGRLVRARRWGNWGIFRADMQFAYDASDQRVRKSTVVDTWTDEKRHSVYVFDTLELRFADFDGDNYEQTAATEVPYLYAHGARLARVVHTSPGLLEPSVRVFLELGDHLGSTSVVLDRATGELVQRSTAYGYGAPESQYRPERWKSFREDYRFTGKEDDIEVGLIYFGARYLNPQLGRWISADPLAVHAPGKADLNLYAYVHGRVLVAVDPVGLDASVSKDGSEIEFSQETIHGKGPAPEQGPGQPNGAASDAPSHPGTPQRQDAPSAPEQNEQLEPLRQQWQDAKQYADMAQRAMELAQATDRAYEITSRSCCNPLPSSATNSRRTEARNDYGSKATRAEVEYSRAQRRYNDAQQAYMKGKREAAAAPSNTGTATSAARMLGERGTQVPSKTLWKSRGSGGRIDVENPNPGERAGQIHFQQGKEKYLYDPSTGTFKGAPSRINELLKQPDVQKALEKAMKILGESG